MKKEELAQAATPGAIVSSIGRLQEKQQQHPHEHGAPMETIREASYQGRRIVIRTTYSIEVDGMPITGHVGVTDDGQVHYHAVPNLGFGSAVDLVKQLIDTFPDDFPPSPGTDKTEGGY